MGGDCLNHGCVPSKAILKAGKIAQAHRSGEGFGIKPSEPEVDWEAVKAHITGVIETIAPVDSVERFEGLGATVITEYAKFVDANTVESETTRVRAKRFVISVGSRASAPPIPGLDTVDYATNENIFSLKTFPKHLLVIGAGPIGLEMGQTFRRLGADVTIIDIAAPLGRNEPEHAKTLVEALASEGVTFHAPARTKELKARIFLWQLAELPLLKALVLKRRVSHMIAAVLMWTVTFGHRIRKFMRLATLPKVWAD